MLKQKIGRLFLAEGAILAAVGSAIGLACSTGYAWLMLAGLRTFWAGAVNSPFLTLHVTPTSVTVGFAASFLVAAFSLRLAVRGLAKLSPRMLLAGVATAENGFGRSTRRRKAPWVFMVALVLGLGLIGTAVASEAIPQALAFFGAGGALLVGGMAAVSIWMRRRTHGVISRGGPMAMARLGLRNATRNRGRSMMTAGLIASATFVVIAVDASRHGADQSSLEKSGGAGGYQTIVESSVALPFDMGTAGGRENLGLSNETNELLSSATVMALRLKPGDDASCLNLYQVARPRILGATDAFIRRGGFAFQNSIATTDAEKENPWTLLERKFDDGAIPAIGDANTLMWLLKVGLGSDFEMVDDLGVTRRLRIVGMLSGSVIQGELVVSEPSFKRLFPGVSGYGFVMVDSGAPEVGQVIAALEHDLARYGADATSTLDRLNQFRAVENTYMSAFGMLGGIGLLLGSLGLAAVMLRNVLERRGEIALLQAVGFSKSRIALTVLAENGALLGAGLLVGGISALTAVLPHVLSQGISTVRASRGFSPC
ncbi:MAG: ABC transporter permease [Planctomycetes bacterium]|nr:ABC transporter permease [Planctomycetota bacterium]